VFVNLKHLGRDGERGVGVGEKTSQTDVSQHGILDSEAKGPIVGARAGMGSLHDVTVAVPVVVLARMDGTS
jgi:hypothetical protein